MDMDVNLDVSDLIVVNKTNIKNVIKCVRLKDDVLIHERINEVVIRVNKIVVHTYQFLKLYLLYLYENEKEFPTIDISFIRVIMKTVTSRHLKGVGRQPKKETVVIMKKLERFYNKYYKKTVVKNNKIYDDKLGSFLEYEAIDIIANIKTNIKEHFIEHVNRFVNCSYKTKEKIKLINSSKVTTDIKKRMINSYYTAIRNIKNDLINVSNEYTSTERHHKWIKKHKKHLLPIKQTFSKNSVAYDVCVNPTDYLKSLIYINNELEKISTDEKEIKLFNIVPLRTNIIPKNITIDTSGLTRILVETNITELLYNIQLNQKKIWNTYFNMNNKAFKKNKNRYNFNYMIKTDGVSCTILFVKSVNSIPIKITNRLINKIADVKDKYDKRYIEKTEITDSMKSKRIVAIDPGYSDIIMCLSKNDINKTIETTNKDGSIIKKEKSKQYLKFRYTQVQRNIETKNKKYSKISEIINTTNEVNNKTIKEIELELSEYNSKICKFDKFVKYIKVKNKINYLLIDHYSTYIHRKLKFNRYVNTQKSESKMIANFRNKYGDPKDVIVIMGDYDKEKNMKGKEPTICKKLRKIFRKEKYNLYLINEFRTSKLCNKCSNENENFLRRDSNDPKHKSKQILVWGLVRCKNVKCKLIHNRDINACKNMLKITKSIFETGERPKEYCRQPVPTYKVKKDYE
jgi:hypothetical protein